MSKKSILITGCSTGIGYDAAHTLHKRGWRVFATCRAEADCERLRAEGKRADLMLGNDVLNLTTDLPDFISGVRTLLEETS